MNIHVSRGLPRHESLCWSHHSSDTAILGLPTGRNLSLIVLCHFLVHGDSDVSVLGFVLSLQATTTTTPALALGPLEPIAQKAEQQSPLFCRILPQILPQPSPSRPYPLLSKFTLDLDKRQMGLDIRMPLSSADQNPCLFSSDGEKRTNKTSYFTKSSCHTWLSGVCLEPCPGKAAIYQHLFSLFWEPYLCSFLQD